MHTPTRPNPSLRQARQLATKAAAALGLAGACALATAEPVVHFDFQAGTQTNTGHNFMTFTSGGVSVTVTAWTTADTPAGVPRSGGYGRVTPAMGNAGGEDAGVYDGDSGLGVFQAGTDSKNLDGGDGSAESDEALMFVFDREVELTAMNFNFWDGRANYGNGAGFGDSIAFHVDGQWVMNYDGAADHAALSMVGRMFVLTAVDDATSVRIQDLDVRLRSVPEPGSFALAGIAMLGLRAGHGRRRTRR